MKPILEFQVNGSFNILKQTIEGMTDEEWTSRPYPSANLVGFTAWHSLRTIDWAINTAIRGVPEMAADPEWRDVKPDGVVATHDELGGSSTDVDHQRRLRRAGPVRHRPQEGQLCLFLSAQHARVEAELVAHAL